MQLEPTKETSKATQMLMRPQVTRLRKNPPEAQQRVIKATHQKEGSMRVVETYGSGSATAR